MELKDDLKRSGAHEQRRTDRAGVNLHMGTCPACGKYCYPDRRAAKRRARQDRARGLTTTRVYKCGDYFHVTSQDTATTTRYREGAR